MTTERLDVLMAPRPVWRGLMHSWAFALSIPAGVLLILAADHAEARVAAAVYVGSLLALFGTSAAYHRLAHSVRARTVMQRLDHSMIYLLIAGTYVPICLLALPPAWGIPLLAVVGGLALLGIVIKLVAFRKLSWLGYALYPIMGWCAVIATPALGDHLSPIQIGLVVAGGLAYMIGFPVLLLKRPDPWPSVFGYHEVWHGCTVLAAALHFGAVTTLVVA
ncbi:MAG: hemolysin III [Acidimicrobiaceae bacterium]|nr:hemolysin III [Acidimicrobiaceae bacterium]